MRRTREQQIADLKEAQQRDELRTSARARLDTIKSLLHRRDFTGAHNEGVDLVGELAGLLDLDTPIADARAEPAQQELAPVIDGKSAAAGPW